MPFTVSRALRECALAFINLAEAFEKHPGPAQPPHLDADALRSVKPKNVSWQQVWRGSQADLGYDVPDLHHSDKSHARALARDARISMQMLFEILERDRPGNAGRQESGRRNTRSCQRLKTSCLHDGSGG
jgi:hypothetical protein